MAPPLEPVIGSARRAAIVLGAFGDDRLAQEVGVVGARVRMVGAEWAAQGIGGGNARIVGQRVFKPLFACRMTADRRGRHRGAVIGHTARDDLISARFPTRGVILKCELHGRLHRFGAAGGDVDAPELLRQPMCLQRLDKGTTRGRDPRRYHVGIIQRRFGNLVDHTLSVMTDIRNDRTAGRIQNLVAFGGKKVHAARSIDIERVAIEERPVSRGHGLRYSRTGCPRSKARKRWRICATMAASTASLSVASSSARFCNSMA